MHLFIGYIGGEAKHYESMIGNGTSQRRAVRMKKKEIIKLVDCKNKYESYIKIIIQTKRIFQIYNKIYRMKTVGYCEYHMQMFVLFLYSMKS